MGAGEMVELRLVGRPDVRAGARSPARQLATTRGTRAPASSTPSCQPVRGRSPPTPSSWSSAAGSGTAAGQVIEGVYVAPSEAHLRRELEEKGLHVLSLVPRGGVQGLSFGRRSDQRHEFLIFNQELATLLKAGMPLVQSLDILRQRLDATRSSRRCSTTCTRRCAAARRCPTPSRAHADLFSGVYTASLVAGERSGSLDTVLRRFVAYSKVIDTVRRKTMSALLYPAILIALARRCWSASSCVKVVPAFSGFYASFDQELPLVTRIIVGVSDVVRANLLAARRGARRRRRRASCRGCGGPGSGRASTAGCCACRCVGADRPQVRHLADRAHAGGARRRRHPARQRRSTPPRRSTGNRYLGSELRLVATQVREGRGFAATLLERQVLPDVAIKMIEVGESTGALQEMLTSLADFYDEDVETEVGRFVTLIEPVLLVFMGVVIAGVRAGALHAALPAVARWSDADGSPHGRHAVRPTPSTPSRARADEFAPLTGRRRAAEESARPPARRALPARVPRHGAVPHRPGAVPRAFPPS